MERESTSPPPHEVAQALGYSENVVRFHLRQLNGADGLAYPTLLKGGKDYLYQGKSMQLVPKQEIDTTLRIMGYVPDAV